ncbi:Activity-regulated cytoskeleton associated protein 2 [Frankliniella fusca]|uniref:Activity-regulated cytoskeleton associated protein 2 n=1 Tax=Frankliniella fusca TaxID=407009 RepID=A0AAE1LCI9_9NEOP|nr:Activity-regulated cytoskeleton associated protein 2 [Frankliniella fusca]
MDITRLHKDELLYEVRSRGVAVQASTHSVADLRAELRRLLDKEAAGEVLEPVPLQNNAEEELILIQTKMDLLMDMVRPVDGVFVPALAHRTRALASHCNRRLSYLWSLDIFLDEAERTEAKKLLLTLKTLTNEFRQLGDAPVYAATEVKSVSAVEGWSVPPPRAPDRLRGSSEGEGEGANGVDRAADAGRAKAAVGAGVEGDRGPARAEWRDPRKESKSKKSKKAAKKKKKSKRRSVSVSSSSSSSSSSHSSSSSVESEPSRASTPRLSRKVPTDLHRWGIQPFSGDQSVSVVSFIADLEEKAKWRRVHPDCLVAAASEFFTGDAKNWFRNISPSVASWKEFTRALRDEFLPVNYYDNLMEEIRARKQGPDESVGAYVSNMCSLFSRLETGLDPEYQQKEDWRLSLTVKNLAPFYSERLALVKVLSFDHLKRLGRDLEDVRYRVESYEGKTRVRKMEPEFASKSPRPRTRPMVHEVEEEEEEVLEVERQDRPKLSCWNCGVVGHRFSACKKEKSGMFCYRCGRRDVSTVNCPRCKQTGEA